MAGFIGKLKYFRDGKVEVWEVRANPDISPEGGGFATADPGKRSRASPWMGKGPAICCKGFGLRLAVHLFFYSGGDLVQDGQYKEAGGVYRQGDDDLLEGGAVFGHMVQG